MTDKVEKRKATVAIAVVCVYFLSPLIKRERAWLFLVVSFFSFFFAFVF